jgi:hypothetical protein
MGQERKLAVTGYKVFQLVLLTWPLAVLPPVLVLIYVGPVKERQAFWSRVNWPWKSIPALKEND